MAPDYSGIEAKTTRRDGQPGWVIIIDVLAKACVQKRSTSSTKNNKRLSLPDGEAT